jgi:hypothetical protein
MPPLKGIDRGLTGEALKALEESGHGRRIAIVDASYDIPRSAQKVDYRGQSSAQALLGVLKLAPIENKSLTIMGPDGDAQADDPELAWQASRDIEEAYRSIDWGEEFPGGANLARRLDEDQGATVQEGFYTIANSSDTLFIRTPDTLPYACATFLVGHSQTGE